MCATSCNMTDACERRRRKVARAVRRRTHHAVKVLTVAHKRSRKVRTQDKSHRGFSHFQESGPQLAPKRHAKSPKGIRKVLARLRSLREKKHSHGRLAFAAPFFRLKAKARAAPVLYHLSRERERERISDLDSFDDADARSKRISCFFFPSFFEKRGVSLT